MSTDKLTNTADEAKKTKPKKRGAASKAPALVKKPTKRNKEKFKRDFIAEVENITSHDFEQGATDIQLYRALSNLVMKEINKNWVTAQKQYNKLEDKQVYFFSIEFLIGRLLKLYINDLGWGEVVPKALEELGLDYEAIQNAESDPALGNGGLGRLMACFLDSTASLDFPGHGNGIRYKYGLFKQQILNNEQVEVADNWLANGPYPFETEKRDKSVVVKFGGQVETAYTEDGRAQYILKNYDPILAVPYDIPIPGWGNDTVNSLRLWSAEPAEEFDLETFNSGRFLQAMQSRSEAESISQILYPSDEGFAGRQMRLKQEYFFTAAGIKRIVRRYKAQHNGSMEGFEDKTVIHINDTHPALAVPELMRILIDEEGYGWDEAWDITTKTITFTNHTVLPEALEKWPISMMESLLPRIYMIIHEINRRFLNEMNERYPWDEARNYRISVLQDGNVHMANLAIIGAHSVNGVAELHSEILKTDTFKEFYQVMPEKFTNVTNGVSQRRFMFSANPELKKAVTKAIGPEWEEAGQMEKIKALEEHKDDTKLLEKLAEIKHENKVRLANYIKKELDIDVNPDSIFDVQVKRIHEYKRQLLNALHIMHLYNVIKDNPDIDMVPRTFILAGKAAPSYTYAKEVIKLINVIAQKINNDPDVNDKLKVVFIPNFNVSSAEIIYPAAEVSEQISTAGKEASGTSNMKFMMNGAVTLGTMDGANIEIREAVGDENIFIFGLSDKEVADYTDFGGYQPYQIYWDDPRVKRIMEQLIDGTYGENFRMIYDSLLLDGDRYFVLRDFDSYAKAHQEVDKAYRDKEKWFRMSLMNTANSGIFSSDRSIADYKRNVWKLEEPEAQEVEEAVVEEAN